MGSYGGTKTIEEAEQIEEATELKFGLERDLEIALRENIEALEPGLRIVDGGKQRTVDGFRLDITAEDTAGRLVILELKAGTANRDAVSQLLAYVGALLEQGETREIRGILVAHEFDRTAKLAARAVGSISLIRYGFQFTFEPG
jgi:RecB family endonuclease NucS